EVEGASLIGGGGHQEREVLFQGGAAQNVEGAEGESVRGDLRFACIRTGGSVDGNPVGAIALKTRGYSEGDWPVRRVLPDRRIPIGHQLVASVCETPAQVVQNCPCNVTGRASKAIFSGKRREGV